MKRKEPEYKEKGSYEPFEKQDNGNKKYKSSEKACLLNGRDQKIADDISELLDNNNLIDAKAVWENSFNKKTMQKLLSYLEYKPVIHSLTEYDLDAFLYLLSNNTHYGRLCILLFSNYGSLNLFIKVSLKALKNNEYKSKLTKSIFKLIITEDCEYPIAYLENLLNNTTVSNFQDFLKLQNDFDTEQNHFKNTKDEDTASTEPLSSDDLNEKENMEVNIAITQTKSGFSDSDSKKDIADNNSFLSFDSKPLGLSDFYTDL